MDALETKLSSDSQNLATLLNLGKDYMAWGVTVRYSGSTDASTSHANELLEKAISYYDQYLALKDSGAVRVDRALCQYYEEETSEATAALEQLTQDMPDYGPAWANLGMLYESAGNSDQAREAYQKAQEADADDEYGAKTYATQRISAMDSAASSSAGTTDSTSATTSGSSTTGSTGVKGLSDTLGPTFPAPASSVTRRNTMALNIAISQEADAVLVKVAGEVDVSNASELRDAIDAKLPETTGELVVDLGGRPLH